MHSPVRLSAAQMSSVWYMSTLAKLPQPSYCHEQAILTLWRKSTPCLMAGTMHLLQQRTVPRNPVSSADHSDFTQEAAAFAARALAYEYTYAHITALSSTSTMGFHRFPFLELVSDTLSSSIQPDIDHSASLDALLDSLSLQKSPSAQPPLIAAALALYQQLATAPLEVQAFCCAHLPRLRAADPWEKFSSTHLAMVHEYMQTCELPIDLAWQDQLQLEEAILCSDWCDMEFVNISLCCLAATIHTPVIVITSSSYFPVVPLIPQDLPLSGLQPIYLATCLGTNAFWVLQHTSKPLMCTLAPAAPSLQPVPSWSSVLCWVYVCQLQESLWCSTKRLHRYTCANRTPQAAAA